MATMETDWGAVGSSAMSGAATGASLGSTFGGVGAAIGGVAGGLLGAGSGYLQGRSQMDAEQRSKAEWDRQFKQMNEEYNRRVADERAYNDPAAQAARLKAAGINPLSAMVNNGAGGVASSTAGNPQAPSNNPTIGPAASPNMSDVMRDLLNAGKLKNLNKQTEKLTVEMVLANWDIALKEQLYDYNSENYPILLDASEQNVKNLMQQYNNLIASEQKDTAAAAELWEKVEIAKAERLVLQSQYMLNNSNIKVNEKRMRQMNQDFETGKFIQEYNKWLAKHEQVLTFLAETQGKIQDAEFQQLYESGLFGDMKLQEFENLKQMYGKMWRENAEHDSIYNTGDQSLVGDFSRKLIYILTNII